MRQSGLLLDENRDVSEACVTRPLVEIEYWIKLSNDGSRYSKVMKLKSVNLT